MKHLLSILIVVTLMAVSYHTSAATINDGGVFDGVNVGFVDRFVVETEMGANSNPTTETAWVNEQIAIDQGFPSNKDFILKTEEVPYYSTNELGVFAFALESDPAPGYFLVKNATRIALFENTINLNWGVFDASVFLVEEVCKGQSDNCMLDQLINLGQGDFTISHVTEFTGTDRSIVPIPASAWLFMSGLIGLVGVSRRKA